ncbi:MAG: phosphoenolpyruvate--protein phosphotransferase [Anaerolineaceae bacterium]|nr:phosphoenolpyruvate--protein phosphotransferase [Anaerolineaceae bacterium]
MKLYSGKATSPGIAIGPAFLFKSQTAVLKTYAIDDPAQEFERLKQAIEAVKEELGKLAAKLQGEGLSAEAEIFEAHASIAEDPELLEATKTLIDEKKVNAEAALKEASDTFIEALMALDDEYLSARAADIADVVRKVNLRLSGECAHSPQLTQPSIIVAEDLMPSDTAAFPRENVLGICIELGSPTSHAAILAKAMGIPAVILTPLVAHELQTGSTVILDGKKGMLIANPEPEYLLSYKAELEKRRQHDELLLTRSALPVQTLDGHCVQIAANLGNARDADKAASVHAQGVGLMRTEFLYLDKADLPDEKEQVAIYTEIMDIMGQSFPLVFRTLDVGGDKPLSAVPQDAEMNPFLGIRGLRLCLANIEKLFKPQLRALLKAASGRNLYIMFPMVTSILEVRMAKQVVRECMDELTAEGFPPPSHLEVGIMIEVPGSAMLADILAPEVDFFSIGTNDLTQYTLAADRNLAALNYLSDGLEPSVLRLIARVAEAASQHGKWAGICGELGGDPQAIPILVGLGLHELSMNPVAIPDAKEIVRNINMEDARQVAAKALQMESAQQVRKMMQSYTE